MHYWEQFSKKLKSRIDYLQNIGAFTPEEASSKSMRCVIARQGSLCLYWLVDEADGVIADAKFQAFGPIALIAAADIACELALRKTYTQASRLAADLIDQHVRDKKEAPAFPKECAGVLNQVLAAIDQAALQCTDIPCAATYDVTPILADFTEIPGGLPGWDTFPLEQKRQIIEEVLDKEIRPYVELDAGGVNLVDFKEQGEVLISYEGSCTSCHSSTGSTLTAIQQILRSRVHPSLVVVPQI